MEAKQELRRTLRAARRDYVTALPDATRALLFMRPPGAVAGMVSEGVAVGLYLPRGSEAPTRGYARWFGERGHCVALPWFAGADAPMRFRVWGDLDDDATLVAGPHGAQPDAAAEEVTPAVVFVPLIGFTTDGHRLGQGGGHYDRWLERHPGAVALGLAWDCQLVATLPVEPHDARLAGVITPTRRYWSED